MASADLNKQTYEFCIELMGAHGMLYGSYAMVRPDTAMSFDSIPKAFLRARANSIEGGTSEVMKTFWASACSDCQVTCGSIVKLRGAKCREINS